MPFEYCLREGGIVTKELDYVAFCESPFTKFDRIPHSCLACARVQRARIFSA